MYKIFYKEDIITCLDLDEVLSKLKLMGVHGYYGYKKYFEKSPIRCCLFWHSGTHNVIVDCSSIHWVDAFTLYKAYPHITTALRKYLINNILNV